MPCHPPSFRSFSLTPAHSTAILDATRPFAASSLAFISARSATCVALDATCSPRPRYYWLPLPYPQSCVKAGYSNCVVQYYAPSDISVVVPGVSSKEQVAPLLDAFNKEPLRLQLR